MDRQLFVDEQNALKAIAEYMRQWFDTNVNYSTSTKRDQQTFFQKEALNSEENAFWDSCIQEFTSRVCNVNHLWDTPERFSKDEDDGTNSDSIIRTEIEESSSRYVVDDPIELIEWLRDELTDFYDFTNTQKRVIKGTLNSLREQVKAYMGKNREEHPTEILSKPINLNGLKHMLNLRDASTCSLLPYLLTAYTFNASLKKSRSFFNGKQLIKYISSTVSDDLVLDPTEAPKMRARIQSFSTVFSLKHCKEDLITLPSQETDSKVGVEPHLQRPQPVVAIVEEIADQERPKPYILYKEVLDQIFVIWCDIIESCGLPKNGQNNALNVDLASCRELYHFYTD